MKSKYLIQIAAKNPMITVNGFLTIDGAMTRATADEKAAAITAAEIYASKEKARAVRVISAVKWRAENSAANRAAMRDE